MPMDQAQLVKWGLPAFAIILLLWYRRRRDQRVDPGGPNGRQSCEPADTASSTSPSGAGAAELRDSGLHDSSWASGLDSTSSSAASPPRGSPPTIR